MSDMFTLRTVPLTPDIGMALKNFRIENKVTAKSITEHFGKASSYISKLEKGAVKKIDGEFLIQLCNFITGTNDGLSSFLNRLAQSYTNFPDESKIIIINIDDLLLEHAIPDKLISEIKEYMLSHNISSKQLLETINSNTDIREKNDFQKMPTNIWYDVNNDIDEVSIKLSVPASYIEDLLDNKLGTIHRVIAEVILYALYTCGKEKDARLMADNTLKLHHILPMRRVLKITSENVEDVFGNLEPDTSDALKNVISKLKLITAMTKEYGSKRIKQINQNLNEDLGFCFAYMALDITELEKKDKEKKKEFLSELKKLVQKYSQEDSSIDLYD